MQINSFQELMNMFAELDSIPDKTDYERGFTDGLLWFAQRVGETLKQDYEEIDKLTGVD